jgi:hypothetical protein
MKIADIEKTDILVGDWGIPSHSLFCLLFVNSLEIFAQTLDFHQRV